MHFFTKDQGPIREQDLTQTSITRLKWLSAMAFLIIPGFISFEFLPDGAALGYVGLVAALLGVAGLVGVLSNPLTSVFGRRDSLLDEWALALKSEALKFSYQAIIWAVAIAWALAALLSLLDNFQYDDVIMDWSKIQAVLFALFMSFFVLPAAYVAWRVRPLTEE